MATPKSAWSSRRSRSRRQAFDKNPTRADFFAWTVLWILLLAGIAWTLFQAALTTFDDCLGRIPDAGLPRPLPPGRSSLSADELLAMVPEPVEGGED